MKKLAYVLGCAIILSGCSTAKSVVIQQKSDPAWPDTIQPYTPDKFKVIQQGNSVFVGMSFDDSQNFRIWLNDVQRYVKDQNSMLCYYRSHLKESRCAPYLPKGSSDATTK